jgi:hypothetical protein
MAYSQLNAETNKGKRFEKIFSSACCVNLGFISNEKDYTHARGVSQGAHLPVLSPVCRVKIFGNGFWNEQTGLNDARPFASQLMKKLLFAEPRYDLTILGQFANGS